MLPLLILLMAFPAHSHGENPGMKLILTNKAQEYVHSRGSELIREEIRSSRAPDVQGRFSLGLLGDVDYVLSGIQVTDCSLPQVSVTFYPEAGGLKAAVWDLSVSASGRWQTHYGLIHDGGSFDLAVSNAGVTSVVSLGRDDTGRLHVSGAFCSAAIDRVGINFHGGASIVFQPFVDLFHRQIRDMVVSKICPVVEDLIAKTEVYLAGLAVSVQVNQDLLIDIPLMTAPTITASSLGLDFKGECHTSQQPTEPPFKAEPFELAPQEDHMLYVGLSEFSVNSALYAYFSTGLLKVHIDDSMIPPGSPFHLNTSSLGLLVPPLPKQFPDMLMELGVSVSEVPMVKFVPGAVEMGLVAQVEAFAAYPNKTLAPLFKVSIHTSFRLKLQISQWRLKGSATMGNLTLTLVSSEIGVFPTAALENAVNMVMRIGVLARLNLQMAQGVSLPVPLHLPLCNPALSVEKAHLRFLSDLN